MCSRTKYGEMSGSRRKQPDLDLIHVNVASVAGAYTVGSISFFRYILRLGELGLPLYPGRSRGGRHPLGDSARTGPGGRSGLRIRTRLARRSGARRNGLARAGSDARTAPQRFRKSPQPALDACGTFAVSAGEIASIEEELDAVYGVIMRAQAAGVAVNVSYVA